MICSQGKELKVLQSAGGYYIGTTDNSEGFEEPYCRCSEYFEHENLIKFALENDIFKLRDCVENNYCNKGNGCIERGNNA